MWTLVFILQKPIFLSIYGGFSHVFEVVHHGLPLDFSMAGYLSAVPALILLISCLPLKALHTTSSSRILMAIVGGWTLIGATVVALSFVANIALYGYWGFPLDSTPIFFLFSSPSAAMASVEWWQGLLSLISIAVVMAFILLLFHLLWRKWGGDVFLLKTNNWQWMPMLILTALLFLPIRGGVTV